MYQMHGHRHWCPQIRICLLPNPPKQTLIPNLNVQEGLHNEKTAQLKGMWLENIRIIRRHRALNLVDDAKSGADFHL